MKGSHFSSRMFASLFVVILGLCHSSKGSQSLLGHPMLSGPSEARVKDIITFRCGVLKYPEDEHILLLLVKETDPDLFLGEFTSLNGEFAQFFLVVKKHHEGYLECVAKAQNNSNIVPTISNKHYLRVVVPVKEAEVVVVSDHVEFFEGERLELRCTVKAGDNVSYKWLLNGQVVSQSPFHYVADGHLLISRTTSKDSGSYVCLAANNFNKTEFFTANSAELIITVKDVVSDPDISFTVLKEDSRNYFALVTCQSTRGTLPVTFSLYNRTELVARTEVGKERNATFMVPLVLDKHMGWLQCQANNGDQTAYSKWIPLEVVPVGGPVTIRSEHGFGQRYAVVAVSLYCRSAKGTSPRYQWFLNNTLLHDKGGFYYVVNQPPEESILHLTVGRSSAGTYHCEVSDSFDNTTLVRSTRRYLDRKVLNHIRMWVVAIVFGCFTFLVVLVSVCCCVGLMFRQGHYGEKSMLVLEMESMVAAHEDELDVSEYDDDAGLVNAARGDEFDQASEASVDEWPQIEKEKKTLEDEAAEEP